MLRKFAVLSLLSLALAGWAAADDRHDDRTVTIMTQNLDDGTDQTYIIAALLGAIPGLDVPSAVDLTFAELQASNLPGRVRLLAGEIAERKPDILALQEAVIWRFQPNGGPEVDLYDNLDLLISALRKAGVPYDKVAKIELLDNALPGNLIGGTLRFIDRNAVLVRSDLRRPGFYLSNVHSGPFNAAFPFAGFTIPAGWISADVHVGDERFRFVTTHLESPIQGIPDATAVQVAQAKELIAMLGDARMPVVMCGDFNSDANGGNGPDATPTAFIIQAAGYQETWPATHRKRDLGLTWPLFLEDQFPGGGLPPPFFAPSQPFERIDLFFSRDIKAVDSDLVLAPARRGSVPPFGSDHAGVIATFKP
jgi:endonuclease/exonuclease/phosphatase family metal-dependent hydrolase